jgi:hypothetical protein
MNDETATEIDPRFANAELKAYAIEYVVGMEVGSDQYRDVQPAMGFELIGDYFGNASTTTGLKPDEMEMLREVRDWISAVIADVEESTTESSSIARMEHQALAETGMTLAANMYPGVDEYEPLLRRVLNRLWDEGRTHPGYDIDWLEECFNEEKNGK